MAPYAVRGHGRPARRPRTMNGTDRLSDLLPSGSRTHIPHQKDARKHLPRSKEHIFQRGKGIPLSSRAKWRKLAFRPYSLGYDWVDKERDKESRVNGLQQKRARNAQTTNV